MCNLESRSWWGKEVVYVTTKIQEGYIENLTCIWTNIFHSSERMSSLSPATMSSAEIVTPSESDNGTRACVIYCIAVAQLLSLFFFVSEGATTFWNKTYWHRKSNANRTWLINVAKGNSYRNDWCIWEEQLNNSTKNYAILEIFK